MRHPTKLPLARELARAFLAVDFDPGRMADSGLALVSGKRRAHWLRRAIAVVAARFRPGMRPSSWTVAREILSDDFLSQRLGAEVRIATADPGIRRMNPAPACVEWRVPPILDEAALEAWLLLSPGELNWFADPGNWARHLPARDPRVHYRFHTIAKAGGGIRLIEAPKDRLRVLQQRILHGILEAIPPHPASTGFRKGTSLLDFVLPHVGRRLVVQMDLRHFFPGIGTGKIAGLFRCAGYPEAVADALALLCLAATPEAVCADLPWTEASRYRQRHLPQGAPTSPLLASLASYRVDRRLSGLAAASGATYSRYADDLAFSWPGARHPSPSAFIAHAGAILIEEGFEPNPRKTRVLGRGMAHRLAGIVVNEHPNLARKEYDTLKAILHNARRHGLASQNHSNHPDFPAHLRGRIAWLTHLNPSRGAKLLAHFEALPPG